MKLEELKKFTFFSVLILLDQVSKYIVSHSDSYMVINMNGSWGILPWWSGIIGIVMLLVVGKRLKMTRTQNLIYMIILVGGISNIWDRLIYGGVVDFIKIGNFPLFNLADIMVTGGAIGMVLFDNGKIEKTYKK